jgi:hypothetical protein
MSWPLLFFNLWRSMPMKTSFLLVGFLVTTVAAAQLRTAPPAAVVRPANAQQMSPVAHVGNEAAVDPQFELLRKQITGLKQQQSQQQNEIARLQTCVRELVKASRSNRGPRQAGGSLNSSPGMLAGTSAVGPPIDSPPGVQKSAGIGKPLDDKNELDDRPGTLAPGPARADLSSCD